MGPIRGNLHMQAGVSSSANTQKLFLISLLLPLAQLWPLHVDLAPWVTSDGASTSLVFSVSDTLPLLGGLTLLHPCPVIADTRAAVPLPDPRLLCSQLQFLPSVPRAAEGFSFIPDTTLTAAGPSPVSEPSLSFPARGKGDRITPEQLCPQLWRWRTGFPCLPGKPWVPAPSSGTAGLTAPAALLQPFAHHAGAGSLPLHTATTD